MTSGIYAYFDNKKKYYVYVGKDSNIHINRRHVLHNSPSLYEAQKINCVLQNNHGRYEYRVIVEGDYNDEELNEMEREYIKLFKTFKYDYPNRTVFNFTRGGDGKSGCCRPYDDFVYTVVKGGFKKGKQMYRIHDRNNNVVKSSIDKEKLIPLADKLNSGELSEDEVKKTNLSGIFEYKIVKMGFRNKKQNYTIYSKDHIPLISSINKEKLVPIINKLNLGEITEEDVKNKNF